MIASGQKPNLRPPACTPNRIDLGLKFDPEIINFFRNNKACTEELLSYNRFIGNCVSIPNKPIANDFKFKMCSSSSLGDFQDFYYTQMKFQDCNIICYLI